MQARVDNQVAVIRRRRGIAVADLAKQAGISRQTIYAIEAGTFVPNTEVALRLARTLKVSMEDLFQLPGETKPPTESLSAEILSASIPSKDQPVRVCQIDEKNFAIPVTSAPYFLPEADGVIDKVGRQGKASLKLFAKDDSYQKRLLLAGCDPAASILTRMVESICGVEIVNAAAPSKLALKWLAEGRVHIAGTHLEDEATGEYNLPYLRTTYPSAQFTVVTFASWEEGLVVAPGNPLELRTVACLTRKGVRFINREPTSGSRALLDKLLAQTGIKPGKITGYERVALGHLAAAYAVSTAAADCCLATRSAAQAFGLGFIAIKKERYDFVIRKETLHLPAAEAFLDVLQRATLRRKLEVLAGYDTVATGSVIQESCKG